MMNKIKIVGGSLDAGDWVLIGSTLQKDKATVHLEKLIASVEIQTEEQAKNFLAATATGVGGALAAGTATSIVLLPLALVFPAFAAVPLLAGAAGLLGGAMAGGNEKHICVLVGLHDKRKFMAVVGQKDYQRLFALITATPATYSAPAGSVLLKNDDIECPFCAELIKRRAVICRFCQREVRVAADESPSAQQDTVANSNTLFDQRPAVTSAVGTVDLEKLGELSSDLAEAVAGVRTAEARGDAQQIADALSHCARLLRGKSRLLEAINLEARVKVIRANL